MPHGKLRITAVCLCTLIVLSVSLMPSTVMVLGDTFMRNVYTLFHFGDKLTMRQGDRPAHIQLLSVSFLLAIHRSIE